MPASTVQPKPRRLLGDLLVETGVITREQLQQALAGQRRSSERLGRVLVRMGFVTERDITSALADQLGIAQVGGGLVTDPQLLALLPEQLARRYKVIPLAREGRRLKVAMADPANLMALDDLRLVTGLEIDALLAGEREIESALQRYYGLPELEKAFQEFQVIEEEALQLEEPAEVAADEAPVVRLVNNIIVQAIEEQASDIHIEPGPESVRVRYRVDGMLREAMQLPRRSRASLAARLKILAQLNIAEKRLPQDGRIQIKYREREIDLRVSTMPTVFGEKLVIRLLDRSRQITGIKELGFTGENLERFQRLLRGTHGMVLVTGPTGSGKTTTLYAALEQLNTPEKNLITIEDPVEYLLPGITQCQVAPRARFTFAAGLRSMLRQDPDVIMVGEIRDGETAEIAVRAATTGHLMLSTLHTNDAAGAVVRLVDMGVEPFLVASSLLGVVAQRLVRLICRHCREAYQPAPDSIERTFLGIPPEKPLTLYRGKGCGYCGRTGYRGRVAVAEVLVVDGPLRQLISTRAGADELQKLAAAQGMTTLREDGAAKVLSGLTTAREVMRVTYAGGN
ncbi:type II secretion system protein GspE [Desulfotomaculum copahuensis]|uniref:Type II secretion system protein GspE n=2 Tax=Desulfotomaculum copahuensis TaxID=1838280 RepID=A0A1B7LBF2_9FIRM|nr:GspE/PulE family protein [Desulfotomaculum copahuensis]OAT79872.1 type II secretion system protein GspE [Desulfotomaculum copahuensis]